MTDFDEWGLRAPALHYQQPLPALGLPRTSPPGQEQCGESTLLHLFNPKSYFYLFVCLGVLLRLQPSSFLVFFFFWCCNYSHSRWYSSHFMLLPLANSWQCLPSPSWPASTYRNLMCLQNLRIWGNSRF